ncbi:MAG: transaldolase, partial [Deltaproteobacteria bacterium]|nr:transaldolase [Deltaproteobacteria bacterium]
QRLLWASTGTKDPGYSDVKYVEELLAPQTVNTLPPKTIAAFRDHGVARVLIDEGRAAAPQQLQELEALGISLDAVYAALQDEGVKAFEQSYLDLLKAIAEKGQQLSA